ncbi:inovirus-type Gp2 protein [Vibrio tubiashii]|uniref:YagK/YfjJ C-terminal domain-containing protein n=1 Tax=Vibrio tubiashii ATCC 19109 TaxID=1051646 RepID=F9TC44_9VIBR|nr:inovirus-type Gp2 protein [Vibrio tubiashii]AIW15085.1 hypothetical protein IX91_13055 [Vibrio tubiashii ATCC 19109]EGU48181.1 hypothetical protein VITU9109_11925 [Vibrio tubiashii ATCC 19109]EIF05377.1 hypothetical protein VT1337_03815 [Vibrio tubiashii NCIMB 1337 = ATCC 19106]
MKGVSTKQVWKFKGHFLKVCSGHLGWHPKIIKMFAQQVDLALQSLKSIVAIRFEVFVAEFTKDNAVISYLRRTIVRHLRRSFENLVIGYLWVREQGVGPKQHYHWVLFVDGKRVSKQRLKGMLKELFSRLPFYTLRLTKNGSFLVKNVGDKQFKKLIYRTSYLAKTRTKETCPEGVHDYGVSRLTSSIRER